MIRQLIVSLLIIYFSQNCLYFLSTKICNENIKELKTNQFFVKRKSKEQVLLLLYWNGSRINCIFFITERWAELILFSGTRQILLRPTHRGTRIQFRPGLFGFDWARKISLFFPSSANSLTLYSFPTKLLTAIKQNYCEAKKKPQNKLISLYGFRRPSMTGYFLRCKEKHWNIGLCV